MPLSFDEQPATLEEAVSSIVDSLNEEELAYVRKEGASSLHMSAGMAMRNGWNLWGTQPDKPTALREHFIAQFGLGHADDMSGMILDAVTAKVSGLELVPSIAAKHYHDYWKKNGRDPLTGAPKKNKGLIGRILGGVSK